jgi:hypothetical protein
MRIATVERVSTSHRTEHTRVRTHAQGPKPENGGALSPTTLAAASLASVVSAIVVSHIWGPGTLYGAAATPIIFALVSETLKRPRRVIASARTATRTPSAFDPLEEGRRGLREGDLKSTRPVDPRGRTIHRAAGPPIPRRRTVAIAVVTGVLAFALAAFVLTGTELVFGHASVGGNSGRTTLFGGSAAKTQPTTGQQQESGSQDKQRTTTTTKTTTVTTPQATPSTTTTTTPSTGTTTPSQTPTNGITTTPQSTSPTPTTTAPPAGQPPAQTTPSPSGP